MATVTLNSNGPREVEIASFGSKETFLKTIKKTQDLMRKGDIIELTYSPEYNHTTQSNLHSLTGKVTRNEFDRLEFSGLLSPLIYGWELNEEGEHDSHNGLFLMESFDYSKIRILRALEESENQEGKEQKTS